MNERESSEIPSYGVVIIGAGVSGLYQLYKSREIGVSALVLESGTDVGGTWSVSYTHLTLPTNREV